MGRYSTPPTVVDENGEFRITRVLDPDDEFAETQYLTTVPVVNSYPAIDLVWVGEDHLHVPWGSPNLHVAHAVLAAYLLGAEDGMEAARRAVYSL